jgi:predicted O-methyltransferase YrrM
MRTIEWTVKPLLADIPRGGLCVEVGTWTGESAVLFAAHFDQVVCVDWWRMTHEQVAHDMAVYGCTRAEAKQAFLGRIKPFDNIAYLHMGTEEAAAMIPDESVDTVYIDSDHSYSGVKKDVALWEPKVKRGGYIAGHDYNPVLFSGCVVAINEALGKPDKVYPDTSWLIRKQ